jgi:hypothetical protein
MAESSFPSLPPFGPRSTEDIALDLMKFIAVTSGYGRMQTGAGFSGKPAARSNEEYAESLLQLYAKCRETVEKKRTA